MLMHELNNFTMSEAVKFYPKLKAAFKALVPIAVSLNKTQPVLICLKMLLEWLPGRHPERHLFLQ